MPILGNLGLFEPFNGFVNTFAYEKTAVFLINAFMSSISGEFKILPDFPR